MKQKEELCDECLANEPLYDAVLNGRGVRLCRRCLDTSNALEIKRSSFSEVPISAPSTKEALSRLSGIDVREWEKSSTYRRASQEQINLDYLRNKKRMAELAKKEKKIEEKKEIFVVKEPQLRKSIIWERLQQQRKREEELLKIKQEQIQEQLQPLEIQQEQKQSAQELLEDLGEKENKKSKFAFFNLFRRKKVKKVEEEKLK